MKVKHFIGIKIFKTKSIKYLKKVSLNFLFHDLAIITLYSTTNIYIDINQFNFHNSQQKVAYNERDPRFG